MIDLLLYAAYASLVLITVRATVLILSSGVAWRHLLSQSEGDQPSINRSTFLLGHLGLALVFLLSVMEFKGDNLDALSNATQVLTEFDFTTASGAVSAFYVWGKIRGRRQSS